MNDARVPCPNVLPHLRLPSGALIAALAFALASCANATAPRSRAGGGSGSGDGGSGGDSGSGGSGGSGGAPTNTGGGGGRPSGGASGQDSGLTDAEDAIGDTDAAAAGSGGAGGAGGAGGQPTEPADASVSSPDLGTSVSDVGTGGAPGNGGTSALTAGWREVPFEFDIHHPYDLPESARHTFDAATNTHTFWVLKTDKPHDPPPNMTAPRTELRMKNDYTSGMHQFEADFYVVTGTDGPCIMQVFGGSAHATAFMLKAYGGALKHYDRELVLSNAYEKWLHLNVIHNADTGEVKAYIDGQPVGTFKDNGPATHYFKCGVYGPTSDRAETRFRNIKNWVK